VFALSCKFLTSGGTCWENTSIAFEREAVLTFRSTLQGAITDYCHLCRYETLNMECLDSIRRYHTDTPTFLHNRPRPFVDHCPKRLPPAASVSDTIQHVHNGTFLVPSVASSGTYTVQLQSSSGVPSCTCPDWLKYRLPCKHMLAVFGAYLDWGWDSLPAAYQNFPHFSPDPSILCRPLESDATPHDDGDSGSAYPVADTSLIQQSPSALETVIVGVLMLLPITTSRLLLHRNLTQTVTLCTVIH